MSEELSATLTSNIDELRASLASGNVFGQVTQYMIWMVIVIVVLLCIVFYAKKHVSLVPTKKHRFALMIEHLADWVRRDICKGVIGEDYKKHMNFLLTLFFFVLFSNLMGLLPGIGKPPTGTMGVTVALAIISFIYFNYLGMKHQGAGRYWLNLAPKGVVFPLNCFVWLIELFSLILRFFTLAIRLFANMYAGHILLGSFSILTSVFLIAAIQGAAPLAAASVGWFVLLVAMYCLETLVACIQAYVFTVLSAVYIMLAESEH